MRLIDADKLLYTFTGVHDGWMDADPWLKAEDVIKDAPTVDTALAHGRWLHNSLHKRGYDYCSVCKETTLRRTYDYLGGLESVQETNYQYCPWCGARMDLDGKDEDNV